MTTIKGRGLAMLLDSAPRTWGSREELHLRFSRALIARGVRPVLVFSEEIPEELKERYRANGIAVEAINYSQGVLHYYRELGRVVNKYSVATVHIAFFTYFSLLPWMARLQGVGYIVYHERNPGVLQAKSWRRQLLRLRTYVFSRPMTRVVAISEFIRRQLIEVGIPEKKITLVHNGVDTQRYLPDVRAKARLTAESSIRPDEIILAALSYLMPHKNIDVIVDACAQLSKRGVAVRFFMIGSGPLRTELEARGQALGIADRVHWLGHILDPVPILQACDIFTMASVGEGFGLALAEAMACGAAAIATRSGALAEIVEDGVSGLLVPPRDVSALADAIQKLAENERLRHEMAQRGMERVQHNFSTDASIEKIMKVYDSMWGS